MNIAAQLRRMMAQPDILFAGAMVMLLAVLVLPMPTWLVDIGLALSITMSVLIFMVALWIDKPLDFSAFPTIILITTLLRLALNLATTRLILAHGHQGFDAAGSVIQGFATFIVGGDFVVGIIVFIILLVVNFIVVTKGAGRIAEVAARFSLDAMPGKQMAIDADLNAGAIDDAEAKRRRKELEDESSFFGAMDGASKFVRGDAIASIIITGINIVGGIVIGAMRHNLSVSQAATNYVTLTIGDGIVSQLPALIVSVGAGLLVSKGSVRGSTDKAIFSQLGNHAKPLYLAGALSALFAILPGLPFLPFMVLSLLTIGTGFFTSRAAQRAAQQPQKPKQEAPKEESISEIMRVDMLCLELGMGLIALSQQNNGLTDKIVKLRRQMALDYGFVLPKIRIKDNMDLASGEYSIQVQGVEVVRETLSLGRLLAFAPRPQPIKVPGQDTVEPCFKMPARWIEPTRREEAVREGLTVVDIETILTTHLNETIRAHMASLLNYTATQKLIDDIDPAHQKLVADLIPSLASLGTVQKVLTALLEERVSIRNLPLILEAIHEASAFARSASAITSHVRTRLGMQICSALQDEVDKKVTVVMLTPEWEKRFADAMIRHNDQITVNLAPTDVTAFIEAAQKTINTAIQAQQWPAIACTGDARPFVRAYIERINASIPVLSYAEIPERVKLKIVGYI